MAEGYIDPQGIWQYGEDDVVSPFSDFMNIGQKRTSATVAQLRGEIESVRDTSWTSYTPAQLNVKRGTQGKLIAEWRGDANMIEVRLAMTFGGADWGVTGSPVFGLPVPAVDPLHANQAYPGTGMIQMGIDLYPLFVASDQLRTDRVQLLALGETNGYHLIGPTYPEEWFAGYAFSVQFSYRPAVS